MICVERMEILPGELADQIESVRQRLVSMGCTLGLNHPDVQKCSEDLDQLLLRYYHSL
ncbi:aspartyl-phosphate phosphatase Spo0E family protein [Paenibacillus sp. y28]|uniref:aspartyl-phosphate phosphatase Spo0E family protein n=1 Tax=Paenibacillus sp. y28 TaxID=3129110 RepID=UPI0030173FEB